MNVYIIQSGKSHYKIGVANNVDARLKDLQTGNPCELRIIASMNFKSRKKAYDAERYLHKVFSKKHIRGEWYRKSINLKIADELFNSSFEESVNIINEKDKKEKQRIKADIELDFKMIRSNYF